MTAIPLRSSLKTAHKRLYGILSIVRKLIRVDRSLMALIGVLSLLLALFSYVSLAVVQRVPYAPDENTILFFTTLFSQTGTFRWESLLNDAYGTQIFRPRLVVDLGDGTFSAPYSPGFILTLAVLQTLGLLQWTIPLFGLLLTAAGYGILSQVYDSRIGLAGAVLIGTFPSVVFYANTFLDIIPSVSVFLAGLYVFLRAIRTNGSKLAAFSGILFATSVFLRVPHAILFVPLGVAALVLVRRFGWKLLAWTSFGVVIGSLPLLVLNTITFGNPFAFGLAVQVGENSLGYATATPLAVGPMLDAALRYLVIYPLAFIVLAIVGLSFRTNKLSDESRFLCIVLGLSGLVWILAYGSRTGTYAFDRITPASSLARYMLPVHVLAGIVAVGFLHRTPASRLRVLSVLVFGVVVLSLVVSFHPAIEGNLPRQVQVIDGYAGLRLELQALYGEGDQVVVFTKRWDKFLFPLVNVGLVFTEDDLQSNPDLAELFPISDVESDVIPLARRLVQDGYRLFLTTELRNLLPALNEGGLASIQKSPHFYEVTLSDAQQLSVVM
jgi:hypothetical protein